MPRLTTFRSAPSSKPPASRKPPRPWRRSPARRGSPATDAAQADKIVAASRHEAAVFRRCRAPRNTPISDIGALLSGIGAAAEQQAIDLQQVNTAISEMDGITRQDTAMVKARRLASEANELFR